MKTKTMPFTEISVDSLFKSLRFNWAYFVLMMIFFQGFTGVDEILMGNKGLDVVAYGPHTTNSYGSASELDTYDFSNSIPFFKSLNTNYISAVEKKTLEEEILLSISPRLRNRAKLYIPQILEYSQKNKLDPLWVLAIVWTESHFKPRAKSYVAATGLMQIMPRTGAFLAELLKRPVNKKILANLLGDPDTNIEMGTFYLKRLLRRFGSHRYATVAYNMGPTFVVRRIRNRGPIGVKNQYYDKVKKYYKFLMRGISKLESDSRLHSETSYVIAVRKSHDIEYYLGQDIDLVKLPLYAMR